MTGPEIERGEACGDALPAHDRHVVTVMAHLLDDTAARVVERWCDDHNLDCPTDADTAWRMLDDAVHVALAAYAATAGPHTAGHAASTLAPARDEREGASAPAPGPGTIADELELLAEDSTDPGTIGGLRSIIERLRHGHDPYRPVEHRITLMVTVDAETVARIAADECFWRRDLSDTPATSAEAITAVTAYAARELTAQGGHLARSDDSDWRAQCASTLALLTGEVS